MVAPQSSSWPLPNCGSPPGLDSPPRRGDGGFLEAPASSSEQKSQNNILDT